MRRQAEAARAVHRPSAGGSHPQQADGHAPNERLSAKEQQEQEKQRAIIRQQYLGQQRQKRRIAKASDKFRYVLFTDCMLNCKHYFLAQFFCCEAAIECMLPQRLEWIGS